MNLYITYVTHKDAILDVKVQVPIGENIFCIPPTLEGWVYIIPTHGPLYTWAQYTPTLEMKPERNKFKVQAH